MSHLYTSVPSVITDRLTATRQNLIVKAVGELQLELQPTSFRQVVSPFSITSASLQGIPAWSSSGQYFVSVDNTGVAVPTTGAYLVTFAMRNTIANYGSVAGDTRVLADIYRTATLTPPTNLIARNNAQVGNVENVVEVTGLTGMMTAGQLITPAVYHNGAGSLTVEVSLTISPIPYLA